jgi:methyl-accepting chemotaxis protein
MDHLTIRQKLFLVFGILIAIFAASSIYAGYALSNINQSAMRIATTHLQSVLSASDSGADMATYRQEQYNIVTSSSLSGRLRASLTAKRLGQQIDITFDELAPALDGDTAQGFQAMRSDWSNYQKTTDQISQLVDTGHKAEALALLEKSHDSFQKISGSLLNVIDDRKDFINTETKNATASYERTRTILTISLLLVLLLSVGMALYLSSAISRSIRYLMMVSREVAGGNLTVAIEAKTSDEFGILTNAYKDTVANLRSLIASIQKTSENVAAFSEQLTANASQSAQATQQVAQSISKVAAAASQQGTSVNRSVDDIRSMSTTIHSFEESAASSSDAAHHVEDIAGKGKTAIDGAVGQMNEITSSVTESAAVIEKLAQRSTEIGQISDTISAIAGQTNLLALNAAIEAARAGDAGRGFAVVAESVRKLAEESGSAAQKIASLIDSIQVETSQAVERMQKGTQDVQSGKAVVNQAGSAFDNIAQAVAALTGHAESILSAAQSSASKAASLVQTMDSLDRSSRDVAAETESVSAATEEQSASMDEIAGASQKLAELAQELQSSTAKFKL